MKDILDYNPGPLPKTRIRLYEIALSLGFFTMLNLLMHFKIKPLMQSYANSHQDEAAIILPLFFLALAAIVLSILHGLKKGKRLRAAIFGFFALNLLFWLYQLNKIQCVGCAAI